MIFNQINNMRRYAKACDYSKLITTLSSSSNDSNTKNWTASKDCWLIGSADAATNNLYNGKLYVGDNEVISPSPNAENCFSLYVTKGSKVGYRGSISIRVYGCL